MDSIDITSTSRKSATASDIVVRTSDVTRLVFRPEIVENDSDPAATLRGTFIYQRKGKNDSWEPIAASSFSTLKKGEGYQLELHAGELLQLMRQLSMLYKVSRTQGVPQGHQQYVRMEKQLAQFLQLGEPELASFLNAHPADAVHTLSKVLRWLTKSSALGEFIESDGGQIAAINAALGVAALKSLLRIWSSNQTNSSEEFWQSTISNHSFVFSQLFAYPIVVMQEKAYLGGKRIDNKHGNIADFLAKVETSGNAVILEIKTPSANLLGAEYRDEAFPLSGELSGAIAQVLKYRDSLTENSRTLFDSNEDPMLHSEPRCVVIAGHSEMLDSPAKRKSFERYRERLLGVTIVTFDELFRRVGQMADLLSSEQGAT